MRLLLRASRPLPAGALPRASVDARRHTWLRRHDGKCAEGSSAPALSGDAHARRSKVLERRPDQPVSAASTQHDRSTGEMTLTSKERAELRAHAHHLPVMVHIGHQGVTDSVRQSLDDALRTKELVKIQLSKKADAKS